ncbi:MAG TPA: hypothetical protein DCR14_17660 [Acidimicrobiaceae bacterium]|nr:hypothetical protein [Acidimicrobiaceae bacterium]
MSEPHDRLLTRRRLLGAAGSAAAVSIAGASTVAAEGDSGATRLGRRRQEGGDNGLQSIPATNPAYEYYSYSGAAFFPSNLANGRDIGSKGATIGSAGDFQAPVTLPVGTVVREMTVWVDNPAYVGSPPTPPLPYLDLARFSHDIDTPTYTFGITVDIPYGQVLANPLTSTGVQVIDAEGNFFFNAAGRPGMHIKAVRLGVIPASLSYRTVTPGRVFDSRPVNGGSGPITSGNNITISVANRINPAGGAVVENDFVPAGARAVTLNVTAVNPVATGYFVVNPGGDTTVGASSVNWTTGENVANGIVCALNGSRQLTIVAGGGGASANVIVDITGYYL